MAQNDLLKRYLDAGVAFTAITQARAEAIVKDLVKAGEVQTDQAQKAVADLLDRSRRNSEKLLETVRKEIRTQVANLGLVSREDLARLIKRIEAARPGAPRAAKAPAKKAVAKKAPAKKAVAKRAPAKKAAKKTVKRATKVAKKATS